MKRILSSRGRPDIDAAVRGGDWTVAMDGEGVPGHATLKQALYWKQIYSEVLGMEEKVLKRIRQLMAAQSHEARVHELNGESPPKRGPRVATPPRAAPRSSRATQTL